MLKSVCWVTMGVLFIPEVWVMKCDDIGILMKQRDKEIKRKRLYVSKEVRGPSPFVG